MSEQKKRVRVVDVASAAGVSISTVSEALSGKNRIPDETRERIAKIAKELGYSPNPLGKALQTGKLPLIGFLVSAIDRKTEFNAYRTYWADIFSSVTIAAANRGYGLVLLANLELDALRSIPFAGIIVVDTHENDPHLHEALDTGLTVVTDYIQNDPRIAGRFRTEYADSVPLALAELVRMGAKKLTVLMPHVADAIWVQNVAQAATNWGNENSIRVDSIHIAVDGAENAKTINSIVASGCDGIYSLMAPEEFMLAFNQLDKKPKLVLLDEDRTGELRAQGISVTGVSVAEYSQTLVNLLVSVMELKQEPAVADVHFYLNSFDKQGNAEAFLRDLD